MIDSNGRHALIGAGARMSELRRLLAQVGPTDASVLVTGPSGSGKELAARALHAASRRAKGPFVALNCGAIPRELLESELFGHERGAFTGAHASRAGRFEAADGGTLFLDEIGDMPLDMQVSLLRVLEERRFARVGSAREQTADVRVVSATHRDLDALVREGRFREDLYYRLNVFPVAMPALADRREDIPELVRHFAALGLGHQAAWTADGLERLVAHDWPGNVRELRNAVERLAIRFSERPIGASEVDAVLRRGPGLPPAAERAALWEATAALAPPEAAAASAPFAVDPAAVLALGACDLKAALAGLERGFIEAALTASGDVVADAARLLGLQRTTLVEKMRRYAVRRPAEPWRDAA